MKYTVDGLSYHFEMCGDGFPLLMLHGFTGRGSNWLRFCRTIGNNARLIMPDIIGHGETQFADDLDSRWEIETVAKDIVSVLSELGYDKFDILGYSMGGRLALVISILYPTRVRKLILESASPGLKTVNERKERYNSDKQLATFIVEKGIESFVEYWENIPLFFSQKSLSDEIRSSIREQRLQNKPIGLANSLLGMGTGSQTSYWDRLSDIQAEVLLIVGNLDQKFCGIAEEMLKKLKKGKIYKVSPSGHAIHVEQPEKFGTIVSGFLSNT